MVESVSVVDGLGEVEKVPGPVSTAPFASPRDGRSQADLLCALDSDDILSTQQPAEWLALRPAGASQDLRFQRRRDLCRGSAIGRAGRLLQHVPHRYGDRWHRA